jgi:hypothetical protein
MPRNTRTAPSATPVKKRKGTRQPTPAAKKVHADVEVEEEEEDPAEVIETPKKKLSVKINTPTKVISATLADHLEGKASKIRVWVIQAAFKGRRNADGIKLLCANATSPKDDAKIFVTYALGAMLGFQPDAAGDIKGWLNSTSYVSGMGDDTPMWKLVSKCMCDAQRSKFLVLDMTFNNQQAIAKNADFEPALSKGNPVGRPLQALLRNFYNPGAPILKSIFFDPLGELRTAEVTLLSAMSLSPF